MDGSPVATAAPPLQQSTDSSSAEDTPRQPTRRTRASRFSVLLEGSVDYASYRAAYGRKYLQQQPHFDSVRDAEIELKCVLHDETFCQPGSDGSIMAENVALAVDWFISALVLLFDCEEPFQNPDFLQLCCMFFASPLYENNARLVQRHLVKRAYAELNVGPEDTYESTLWLLLAFLHLITEFQPDTHLLCKDSGLFPLLQRLVLGCAEKHLHVLAMSLMFEVAQAVTLSQTDFAYVTDELLLFLLDYIERMRYADSDVYNNTGTKLVLALNEQFLRLDGYASMPQSPVVSASNNTHHPGTTTTNGSSGMLWVQHRELIDRLSKTGAGPSRNYVAARRDSNTLPPTSAMRSMHIRTASANVVSPTQQQYPHQQQQQQQQQPDDATLENRGGANLAPPHSTDTQGSRPTPATSPRSVALRRLPSESNMLPRSRSMDFRVPPLQKQQSESHRDPPCCIQRATSECYEEKGTSIHAALADNKKSKSSCCSPRGGIAPRIFPTSTPVVAILANRIDCCKTFTENLVFLLNRETDPSTQILILHMLNCILADPSTAGILYTNDMHVLIDIVLRDLNNLADSMQQLKQAYLLVVGALLRNPSYLTTRHRLSDIELCLVGMLRHALECSQEPPLPVISRSRRGSASSSASTRHNSMASDVLVLPMSGLRRESGAVSPVSSLSSSMSEETCCPRSVDDQPLLGSTSHKQHMRRPAPPPPPSRRKPGDSSHSRVSTSSGTLHPPVPPPPPHRRRPAPPPPPPSPRSHQSIASSSRSTHAQRESNTNLEPSNSNTPRPTNHHHRRPPPPPPPSRAHALEPTSSLCRPSTPSRAPPPPLPSTALSQSEHTATARENKSKPAVCSEKTGMRRQLSVKKSVSKYKRNSSRPAPLPPPRSRNNSNPSTRIPVSPVIEVSDEINGFNSHNHGCNDNTVAADLTDGFVDDDDMQSIISEFEDSVERRRATRKLVENALKCCHEARIMYVTQSPA